MEQSQAWTRFYETGNVEDYLNYVNSVKSEVEKIEQDSEGHSHKRNRL